MDTPITFVTIIVDQKIKPVNAGSIFFLRNAGVFKMRSNILCYLLHLNWTMIQEVMPDPHIRPAIVSLLQFSICT